MSTNTKGFVATPCKNVFFIAHLVERSLDRLIRDTAKAEGGYEGRFLLNTDLFSLVDTRLRADTFCVDAVFKFRGESRTLSIFFDCDSDHTNYCDKSIVVVLGAWGSSVLLIRTVLEALSAFGPVYISENDDKKDDYEPLSVDRMTYVRAVSKKIVPRSIYELKRWQKICPELRQLGYVYPEFLGFTVHELNRLFAAGDGAEDQFEQLMACKLEQLDLKAA